MSRPNTIKEPEKEIPERDRETEEKNLLRQRRVLFYRPMAITQRSPFQKNTILVKRREKEERERGEGRRRNRKKIDVWLLLSLFVWLLVTKAFKMAAKIVGKQENQGGPKKKKKR